MATNNPADHVEKWQIERLTPYERNARTHSEAQLEQIAASIKEWGWTTPVLVQKSGVIIAGHGRVEAARRLGIHEVPVIVADGWTDAQVRAYALADNRIALSAGWDVELLAFELDELRDLGADLALIGFTPAELNDLIGTPNTGVDPDAVPAIPVIPTTELGDVWICGKHRVICGDATLATDVERLLGDIKPLLMVTDPPYGVKYDPNWQSELGKAADGTIQRITSGKVVKPNPKTNVGSVLNDDRADWRDAWSLFPGDVAYVWHADRFSHVVAESLEACEFQIRNLIVWGKSQLVMSRGNYHSQHEPCWYVVRNGKTGHWSGDRKQTTLWQIDKPQRSETGHGTQKPVECMRRPIENNSSPGQAIYDPFLGSGTTMIAAEQVSRACYGIELNSPYVDVSVMRWQEYTGKTATLEADGRTFEEVKRDRSTTEANAAETA